TGRPGRTSLQTAVWALATQRVGCGSLRRTPRPARMSEPSQKNAPVVPAYDEVWANVYGDIQEHGPVHRHLARLVRRVLAGLEYSTVIDIGCGPGHNFDLVAG